MKKWEEYGKEKYVIVRCDRSSPFAGLLVSRKGQALAALGAGGEK